MNPKDKRKTMDDNDEKHGPQIISNAASISRITTSSEKAGTIIMATGRGGTGKSTLTGALTTLLAAEGRRPAVVAVDPSSPLTGGAILGDRVRMEAATGAGVFIRSMATRGHAGGLALAVPGVVRVLDACGFDPVLVETVGVGQIEVDVAAAADTAVVVVTPGWGDAIQANKAGLLEVADLFVVNKADRPGASDARRDLDLMLDLSEVSGAAAGTGADAESRPAIIETTATEGEGVQDLLRAVDAHHRALKAGPGLQARRDRRFVAEVRARLEHVLIQAADDVLVDVDSRSGATPVEAARHLADRFLDTDTPR